MWMHFSLNWLILARVEPCEGEDRARAWPRPVQVISSSQGKEKSFQRALLRIRPRSSLEEPPKLTPLRYGPDEYETHILIHRMILALYNGYSIQSILCRRAMHKIISIQAYPFELASFSESPTHSPPRCLAALLSNPQPLLAIAPFAITCPPNFVAAAPCRHLYCGDCLHSFSIKAIKAAQCTAPTHLAANLSPVTTCHTRSTTSPRTRRRRHTAVPWLLRLRERIPAAVRPLPQLQSAQRGFRTLREQFPGPQLPGPIRFPSAFLAHLLELPELQPLPPLHVPATSTYKSPSYIPLPRECVMFLFDVEAFPSIPPCGHVLHEECITASINNRQGEVQECPLCKTRIAVEHLKTRADYVPRGRIAEDKGENPTADE